MRSLNIFASLATLIVVSCAHRDPLTATSEAQGKNSNRKVIARLNEYANDSKRTAGQRSEAVFTLFRKFIKPGATVQEIHTVLTDSRWLEQTRIYGCYCVAGMIPLMRVASDETTFVLHLFPKDGKPPGLVIYFTLSGAHQRPERSAMEILSGDRLWDTNTRLVEFALCYSPGCYERVTANGILSYP